MMRLAQLLHDDVVRCEVEIAQTRSERRRGLLGRESVDSALYLPNTRWIHTLGMRIGIDVVYLDSENRVISYTTMHPWRVARPVMRARSVIELAAGEATAWGLRVGHRLEIQ